MGSLSPMTFCMPKDKASEDEVIFSEMFSGAAAIRRVSYEKLGLDQIQYENPLQLGSGLKALSLRIQLQENNQVFYLRDWLEYDLEQRVTIFNSPFATVGKFIDSRTGKPVAVKLIRNAKERIDEIVNEVTILRYLNNVDLSNQYYPELHDVWVDESNDTAYLSFEFFDYDIELVLCKMRKKTLDLEKNRVKYFIWKMLLALDLLKQAEIIHLDVKPQNFLASKDLTEVRLTDFGSARRLNREMNSLSQDSYTYGYIPMEVLVGHPYRFKADVFAVGCVWWEMLRKGNRLVDIIPTLQKREQQVEDNIVQLVKRLGKLKDNYGWILNPERQKFAVRTLVSDHNPFGELTDPDAVEVLAGMLALNPSDRWGLSEVINHGYFSQYREAQPLLKINTPFTFQKPESKEDMWNLLLKIADEFTEHNALIRNSSFQFLTTEEKIPVGSNLEITM